MTARSRLKNGKGSEFFWQRMPDVTSYSVDVSMIKSAVTGANASESRLADTQTMVNEGHITADQGPFALDGSKYRMAEKKPETDVYEGRMAGYARLHTSDIPVRLQGLRFDIVSSKRVAEVRSECEDYYAYILRTRYNEDPDNVTLTVGRRGEDPLWSKRLPPKMGEWGEGDLKGWMADRVLPPIKKAWEAMNATVEAHLEKMGKL